MATGRSGVQNIHGTNRKVANSVLASLARPACPACPVCLPCLPCLLCPSCPPCLTCLPCLSCRPACAAALLCLLQNVHAWCSEHPFGTNRNVANAHLTSLKDFQNGLIQIRTEKCPNEAIWKQICHSFGMVYQSSKLGADVLLIKWRPTLAATW